MRGLHRYRNHWRVKSLSLILTFALALNILGPLTALPEKDGFVAICTGSEIVYIPIAELGVDLPNDEKPQPKSESCPWFSNFHAVESIPTATISVAVVHETVTFRPADQAIHEQQTPNLFQARAPPRSGA